MIQKQQPAAVPQTVFNLIGTPYVEEKKIGRGAFGVVCKAIEQNGQKTVAIKKIPCAFMASTLARRALREVTILKNIQHENIVSIVDMFTAAGHNAQRDVYIVMTLMETDLHQIIHSQQSLVDQHYEYFMYQILRGLKYLHSAGIIHRDLKPSNLLVNSDCLLAIADFGMARCVTAPPDNYTETAKMMTLYVATRWYRAPEILFSAPHYDTKADLWSAGCIFAEMIIQRQIFPGKDLVSQVKMIVTILGTPDERMMNMISSDVIKEWIQSVGAKTSVPWHLFIPKANQRQLAVLERMLTLTPWTRCSAEEALALPYFSTYHDPSIEPSAPQKVYEESAWIEVLEAGDLRQALNSEADYFESLRGPYDNCSSLPPVDYSSPFPYTDPTDIPGLSYLDQMGRDEEQHTPTPSTAPSSASTIVGMEARDTGSQSDGEGSEGSQDILTRAEQLFPGCSRDGVEWDIPESGTSSAPDGRATAKQQVIASRKAILKDRFEKRKKKPPKPCEKTNSTKTEDERPAIMRLRNQKFLRKSSEP